MTRKEEIQNASVAYNEKIGKLLVIGGDSILSEEEYLEFNKNPSFIAGAEWADKTMLDKVCEWLKSYRQDTYDGTGYIVGIVDDKTIEDLRKAMEDKL